MSDDLISRQAAIEFIKDHSYPVRYDNNSIEQGMTVTGIEQALNEVPSVQPKTGQWVKYPDCGCFKCSECGTPSLNRFRYCHGCGAKMEERWSK